MKNNPNFQRIDVNDWKQLVTTWHERTQEVVTRNLRELRDRIWYNATLEDLSPDDAAELEIMAEISNDLAFVADARDELETLIRDVEA